MDIRNAESAYALAQTQFKNFIEKFLTQWYEPMLRTQLAIMIKNTGNVNIEDNLKAKLNEQFGIDIDELLKERK